ncbi:MAG: extracellular solute-binding protein [Desulfobacterales bacterium]|jgi:tungstate transport system substrate-binding protein
MNRLATHAALITVLVLAAPIMLPAADRIISMATTTSTQASGLLDQLLPAFEKDTGIKVKVIAKGTGAAIRDGMDGNVDIIFVHAKGREEAFVKEGYGTKRYAVMHNDFVILGPDSDPAGIKGETDVAAALKKIAAQKAIFVSRGDDSGTHTKEQQLWKETGLPLQKITQTLVKKGKKVEIQFAYPGGLGKWYMSIGQGMGKALTFADEKQGYVMSDRGTYIKYKYGREQELGLTVLCEGDQRMANPYGVIPVNPRKYPQVNHAQAKIFAEWLVSERGQALIANYRLLDKPLFYPDAMPEAQ